MQANVWRRWDKHTAAFVVVGEKKICAWPQDQRRRNNCHRQRSSRVFVEVLLDYGAPISREHVALVETHVARRGYDSFRATAVKSLMCQLSVHVASTSLSASGSRHHRHFVRSGSIFSVPLSHREEAKARALLEQKTGAKAWDTTHGTKSVDTAVNHPHARDHMRGGGAQSARRRSRYSSPICTVCPTGRGYRRCTRVSARRRTRTQCSDNRMRANVRIGRVAREQRPTASTRLRLAPTTECRPRKWERTQK